MTITDVYKKIWKATKNKDKTMVTWLWITSSVLAILGCFLWCTQPWTPEAIVVEAILSIKIAVNCVLLVAAGKWSKILLIALSGIAGWGICTNFGLIGCVILMYVGTKMAIDWAYLP